MPPRQKTAVVAAGGNSLIIDVDHKSIPDQYAAAATTVGHVADMIEQGWDVVLTHGNGPQVGFILRRSEMAIAEVPPVPMDYAGADTQGAIGWMFQRAMQNEMRRRGIDRHAVAVVTQVLVDRADPAFTHPSKPIGSHMTEDFAKTHAAEHGWQVREEGDRGWRRVVASPRPQSIVDIGAIETLIDANHIVIACGGGGIPVYRDVAGDLQGLEAVIDKDLASSLLAHELNAEFLVITTEVEKVAVNFGKPDENWIDRMTVSEARAHQADGQFPEGSMGPKIDAIVEFIELGGGIGIVTNPQNLGRAIAGETGTWIVPDKK